jgi:hypothetical protein
MPARGVLCCQVVLAALPLADGQPAGYMCREQECDMKFMLAFKEPSRALEWCLLVQVKCDTGVLLDCFAGCILSRATVW